MDEKQETRAGATRDASETRDSSASRRAGLRRVDRRITRSKRAIVEAFDRLLFEHPLDEITVSAIAREADVDRKTFYKHFGSIDGLLDALAEECAAQVLDAVEDARRAGDGASTTEFDAFFSSVNEAFVRAMPRYRRYVENGTTEELLRHISGPLERGIIERGLLPDNLSAASLSYSLTFVLGGLSEVYHSWLNDPDGISLDELAGIVNELAGHGVLGLTETVEQTKAA